MVEAYVGGFWDDMDARAREIAEDDFPGFSHPAIIAREFGIPAVVATRNATAVLRDGQAVVVDSTAGTVRIEP